jgi:glutathione S-transferase
MGETLILHEDPISANCYKIRLTAALLSIPLERRSYSILDGETRTANFLTTVSPYGRIPVLQIDHSTFLPESNAACYYLADTTSSSTSLIPTSSLHRAQMLQWLFFEQNQHEVNIATLRFWLKYIGEENLGGDRLSQIAGKKQAGNAVLTHMDDHLSTVAEGWFVGGAISLADICLFAYTHVAGEAGFNLDNWPHVRRWCERVAAHPGFVPMK